MPIKLKLSLKLATALSLTLLSTPAFAQGLGFSVAVDGEHLVGDPLKLTNERVTDVALAATDIQVRYAGMDIRPSLNILTKDLRQAYRAGEMVEFYLTTNYPAFIARSEVIVVSADGDETRFPVEPNTQFSWTMPADGSDSYTYRARVYDARGRYDETAPLNLQRTDRPDDAQQLSAPGWGEDRAALRAIPLSGGAVTVHGTNVGELAQVKVFGELVPVDPSGAFVIERILPAGQHDVDISVTDPTAETLKFRRPIAVPDSDWFYVALADLTLGARSASARLEPVSSAEFSDTYAKGQLQFYLKGKIKGEYLLTASGDTGEGPLHEMFEGVLSKDPRAIVSRIDPNEYYPVYGDDSELINDAPTRGKLYVRLEKGNSNVMWGTFRTEIANSHFYADNRVLYGASAKYVSDEVTQQGRPHIQANLHAAYPGTLSQRDILRGSGGSAYFLHRQDILPNSETLTLETRDGITGLTHSRRTLVKGTDYRINYMQGVVILTTPLASSLQSGAIAGSVSNTQHLVAQYEFTPAAASVEDYAFAGAAQAWVNDHLSLGATAVQEDHEAQQTQLLGANARLQADEKTYVEAEIMRSEGIGSGSWVSTDGGLTFVEETLAKRIDPAYAARISAEADLSSIGVKGAIGGTVEARGAGFASTSTRSNYDQLLYNTFAKLAITDTTQLDARYDSAEARGYDHARALSVDLSHELNEQLTLRAGVGVIDVANSSHLGSRTDLGAGLTYAYNEDLELTAFARKTVSRTGSLDLADRLGVGIDYRLSDSITAEGEISYGSTGLAGLVGLVHQPSTDERNYIGYRVNADENPSRLSTARSGVVVGTERKVNEVVALHSEAIYNTFARNRTLTQSYGVTLTPDTQWTINAGFERGNIYDPNDEDIERTALSFSTGYISEGVTGSVRGELRDEHSTSGKRNGQSLLIGSSLSWRTDDDWRLIGSFDSVVSHYDNTTIIDGDYVEASLGYAYRPVDNERLNALMRYTYLYDLPTAGQVSQNYSSNGPAQRSHIVSIDANYDINEWLTVGAKYGARIGEISESRRPDQFARSSAHLGIIRVDAEIHDKFDLLLEGRAMALPEINTIDVGALAALYYSVDDHVKVGVGYSFAAFSDDLRDLERDHQGVFFNILAKY